MNSVRQPLSVIVPTLNEADNLGPLFSRIDKTLSTANIPYEIILIDDHSKDDTVALAETSPKKYSVKVFSKVGKRGKASSLLEGFGRANYDLVCMIDADLQYPPEAIPEMYNQLVHNDADLIVTNRVEHKSPLVRRVTSKVFNLLFVRALFGIGYDTQSGLKLFKKKILNNMTLTPSPWSFDLEFIVRAMQNDYSIFSYDIPFGKRFAGEPKVHVLATTYELAHASIKLKYDIATSKEKFHHHAQHLGLRRFVYAVIGITGSLIIANVASEPMVSADALNLTSLNSLNTDTTDLLTAISNTGANVNNLLVKSPAVSSSSTSSKASTSSSVSISTPIAKVNSVLNVSNPSVSTPTSSTSQSTKSTASASTSSSTGSSTPTSSSSTNTASGTTDTTSNSSPSTTSRPLTVTSTPDAGNITVTPDQLEGTASNPSSASSYKGITQLSASTKSTLKTIGVKLLEVGGILLILGILSTAIKSRHDHYHYLLKT